MDPADRAILEHLQHDGRMGNLQLAEAIHLSPSQTLRRVRRLEQAGVISGYRAVVDPAAVGRAFEVTVHADMAVKDRGTIEAFEEGIRRLDEVLECRRMFGVPDYIIRVAVADLEAYEALYMGKLADLPGVGRLNSQFAMKVVKGD